MRDHAHYSELPPLCRPNANGHQLIGPALSLEWTVWETNSSALKGEAKREFRRLNSYDSNGAK